MARVIPPYVEVFDRRGRERFLSSGGHAAVTVFVDGEPASFKVEAVAGGVRISAEGGGHVDVERVNAGVVEVTRGQR